MKTFSGNDLYDFINQDREDSYPNLFDANINNLNDFSSSALIDNNTFCIYFLCYRGHLQYIGKTINLCGRIGGHKGSNKFKFDSVYYIVPKFLRRKHGKLIPSPYYSDEKAFHLCIERIFIKFFEPKYNSNDNPRFPRRSTTGKIIKNETFDENLESLFNPLSVQDVIRYDSTLDKWKQACIDSRINVSKDFRIAIGDKQTMANIEEDVWVDDLLKFAWHHLINILEYEHEH